MNLPNPRLSPSEKSVTAGEVFQVGEAHSLWEDAWARLKKNKAAMSGLAFFIFIILFSFLGPFLTPYTFQEQERTLANTAPMALILEENRLEETVDVNRAQRYSSLAQAKAWLRFNHPDTNLEAFSQQINAGESVTAGNRQFTPVGRKYLLGTDKLGRDLLTRLMVGGRVSLAVGFLATLVSVCIGVLYGSIAGYLGGKTDVAMMRFVDILYAMPFVIFVILLMTFFGRYLWLMFLAIGAVEWLTMARIVRGQVVSLKKQEFVEAAIALGQKQSAIISKHIIPNVLGPVIVYSTLTVPAVILLESFLSFLGLGVQAPMASWGVLIDDGRKSMENFPWQLIFPALLFSMTLLSMNFLGDGLRDALDPRNAD